MSNNKRFFERLREVSISDLIFKLSEYRHNYLSRVRKLSNSYEFINRSKGAENLLLILAGFQPEYWDVLLGRVNAVAKQFKEPMDICICVPSADKDGKLRVIAEKYGWSYLRIKQDLLGRVQNIAIKIHPNANYIFKIDEDIVLPNSYFDNLKAAYHNAEEKFHTAIGFIGPCINLNPYSVLPFVEGINKSDEFVSTFGKYTLRPHWLRADIYKNVDLALWLWKYSVPFDKVASELEINNKGKLSLCPHRYCIGAFLFERQVWNDMGYFTVGCNVTLGLEEADFCAYCCKNMLGIAVAEDIMVGHLGFNIQKKPLYDFFVENIESFKK